MLPIWVSMLTFVVGWILGRVILLWEQDNKIEREEYQEYLREKAKCPHGYGEWNDCPDCCH